MADGCGRQAAKKLFVSIQHRQTKFCVRAISLDALEHARSSGWHRWEHRIVPDVAQRALTGQRDLHARIQQALGSERVFHSTSELEGGCAGRAIEQRSAQGTITVLP